MKEIKAFIQPFMLEFVCDALDAIEGLPGVMVSQVSRFGQMRDRDVPEAHAEAGRDFSKRTRVEMVVPDALADRVVEAIARAAHTGRPGDGKVFVSDVTGAVRICNGEKGEGAL